LAGEYDMEKLIPLGHVGESNLRNIRYEEEFSYQKYFASIISNKKPIILDVGAHKGESIKFFKSIFANSTIYSFEPNPENFLELKKIATNYNTSAFELAVGQKKETVTFYNQSISHLGSVLPINKNSQDSLGYAENATNKKIRVQQVSLDDFMKNLGIHKVDLLKIDVQSYEIEVLKGALSLLKTVSCVSLEISLYDFYQTTTHSKLFQIEKIMNESGMALWDIAKVSKNPKNLRTDWFEAVYVRKLPTD
jgi:FkbM family methyltransferase